MQPGREDKQIYVKISSVSLLNLSEDNKILRYDECLPYCCCKIRVAGKRDSYVSGRKITMTLSKSH